MARSSTLAYDLGTCKTQIENLSSSRENNLRDADELLYEAIYRLAEETDMELTIQTLIEAHREAKENNR